MRLTFLAATYGALAGMLAALTLSLMLGLEHLIWSVSDSRFYIFAVIMVGGLIIALLRNQSSEASLDEQIHQATDPVHIKKRAVFFLALAAIVAVSFGGAIGPEAGMVAVIAEISAIVALLIGRNHAEQKMIGEAGVAGALSGLYGSPPGGAMYADEEVKTPNVYLFLAAITGLGGFLVISRWLIAGEGMHITLPEYSSARDGYDIVLALLPALLGALTGVLFKKLNPLVKLALEKINPSVFIQTLVGTGLFAVLATTLPILRFSGHHEMELLFEWTTHLSVIVLVMVALLKVLATSICLNSGWHGGAIFPLIFAGAAAGAAATVVLPDLHISVALAAGMTASAAIGLGRPVVAALITMFFVGVDTLPAIFVGALIAALIINRYEDLAGH